jgi:hypothetical protein
MTVKEMEPVRATASALFLSFPFFASGVRSDRRRVKRSTPLAPKANQRRPVAATRSRAYFSLWNNNRHNIAAVRIQALERLSPGGSLSVCSHIYGPYRKFSVGRSHL